MNKSLPHKRRIVIRDGVVGGFADEVSLVGLQVDSFLKERVSHVVPRALLLQKVFTVLRRFFSDTSMVAVWTRRWKCQWNVRIDSVTFGPFDCREQAIKFEKEKIYSMGRFTQSHQKGGVAP